MHDNGVVITGYGTISPDSSNIPKESPPGNEILVRYVNDDALLDIPRRTMKKIDRFTALSILAINKVRDMANLGESSYDSEDIGLFVGNIFAGWGYVDQFMENLYTSNELKLKALNPYIATAWFPTAAQGEVSIIHKYLGYSKTFSAGILSSGFALLHGYQQLLSKKLKAAITGGSEAVKSSIIAPHLNDYKNLVPYQEMGEGAAYLSLENESNAIKRNANIYSRILAVTSGADYLYTVRECLNKAGVDKIDGIMINNTEVSDSILELCSGLPGNKIPPKQLKMPKMNLLGGNCAYTIVNVIEYYKKSDRNLSNILITFDSGTGRNLCVILSI